jgi:hypothetical protein
VTSRRVHPEPELAPGDLFLLGGDPLTLVRIQPVAQVQGCGLQAAHVENPRVLGEALRDQPEAPSTG